MNLQEKIKKIEALIAQSRHEGERAAAELARQRLQERHQEVIAERPVEYRFSLQDSWRKKLFMALCNKHRIRTYRYNRQKHTTAMLRAPTSFVKSILEPEFNKYSSLLEELAQEILDDLIKQIHDVKEEEVVIMDEIPVS